MAEEKGIRFGVEFNVDDSGNSISEVSKSFNEINKSSKTLAANLSNIETSYSKLTKAAKEYNEALDKVNNGGVSASEKLKAELKQQSDIEKQKIKSAADIQKNADKLLAQAIAKEEKERKKSTELAKNLGKELTEAEKEELAKRIEYSKDLARAKEQNNAKIENDFLKSELTKRKLAKDSADVFKEYWQQETNQQKAELKEQVQAYQNAQSQMRSGSSYLSSLTNQDTTLVNASSLRYSILSAGISLVGIRALAAAFSELGTNIVEVNYNAVNTQRIMDDFSSETAERLISNAVSTAKATGTQVTDIQEIQSAWVRINEQYAESEELLGEITTLTAKFMNVGEIEDAEEAVKLLNATLLQFSDGTKETADFAEEVLNKWAYMANKTALGTADEFGSAMSKIGGYMKTIGGDVDDAIVMTSILGDRLAKSGDEAGNSLKTINSYLTRQKTVNLFDSLGSDANGVSYSLKDVNGQFKDFTGLMETASRAYNDFSNAGNDAVAKQIQEALGATRQGDVALTLLQNWATDSAKYYAMVEESVSGETSYLDEQNAALMESFRAQWNSLYATIIDLGMAVGNSGLLDGITNIMGGFEDLFNKITEINPELLNFAATLGGVAIGVFALKSIGDMTGLLAAFTTATKLGTQQQRQYAASITETTDAYFKYNFQQAKNAGNEAEIEILKQKRLQYNQLAKLYKEGAINATEYATALKSVVGVENLEVEAAKKQAIVQEVNNTLKEAGVIVEKESAIATALNSDATLVETANTLKNTVATSANIAAQKALNGVKQVATMLKGALLNPLTLVTVGVSALIKGFDLLTVSSEEAQEKLDELTQAYDKLNTEIEELESKRTNEGLTASEQERLDYLRERVDLEEQIIENQKLENAQNEIEGSNPFSKFFTNMKSGFSLGSDGATLDFGIENTISQFETLSTTISDLESQNTDFDNTIADLQTRLNGEEEGSYYYNRLLEQIEATRSEQDKWNTELDIQKGKALELQATMLGYIDTITEYENAGYFTDEQSAQFAELKSELQTVVTEVEEVTDSVETLNEVEVGISFEEFMTDVTDMQSAISALDEDIEKIAAGTATAEDLVAMMNTYSGSDFYSVANQGAEEQLALLRQIKADKLEAQAASYDEKEGELLKQKRDLLQEIARLGAQSPGVEIDTSTLNSAAEKLERINSDLDMIQATREVSLYIDVENTPLEETITLMDNLVSSTSNLTAAQEQLAQGTALSAEQLYKLAQEYPELLKQSNLFNSSSVEGQQSAISAIIDMKDQEFDAEIDIQIKKLEAEAAVINQQLGLENQKQQTLAEIAALDANTSLDYKRQLVEGINEYNNEQGQDYVALEDGVLKVKEQSLNEQLSDESQAGEANAEIQNENKDNIKSAWELGGNAAIQAVKNTIKRVEELYSSFKTGGLAGLAQAIKSAFSGEDVGDSALSSKLDGNDDISKSYDNITFDVDGTASIGGKSVDEWVKNQTAASDRIITESGKRLAEIEAEIGNLDYLKNLTIPEIINKFNPNDESDIEGIANDASDAAQDAADAAKDAADAAQSASDAVQKIKDEYSNNVEALQDRIVKALKEKYQEMFDERMDQLEDERDAQIDVHNDRIDQLQDEIDKINGETPEDKLTELASLEAQLNRWKKDDSSLGLAKQKELQDAIDELNKEIAIDDLEAQIDAEESAIDKLNDDFDAATDEDSDSYDSELADISKKLSNQSLYAEANEMIRQEQTQEIIDLLLAYDPDYSGIAQLMGATAGQIIAVEVMKAINNYLDLKNGTITDSGGTSSNGGDSTGGGGGGTDANGNRYHTVDGGDPWGDTLWDLAEQYYGDGSQWEKIYNANADQIEDPNTIYPGQRLLIPFKIGGYTGDEEGVAYLHKRERVLTEAQTQAFDNLVYNTIPKLDKNLVSTSVGDTTNNSKNINYNGEMVKIEVGSITNNTPFDISNSEDNLNKIFKSTLLKSGTKIN